MTARTLIDCDTGKLTCQFAGETVTFDIYKAEQFPADAEIVDQVEVVKQAVEESAPHLLLEDVFEKVIQVYEESPTTEVKEVLEAVRAMETEVDQAEIDPAERIRGADPNGKKCLPSLINPPRLELKRLSKHLKYIYLGQDETVPVIISLELSEKEEEEIRILLSKYKEAIGWTLADLRGVSPTICQHHILLEKDALPIRDHQRKLSPVLKEVVKKEILKLLEMGMIYPVSDSQWVSPIHVVPKKSGVQVIENDNKELVATRL